MGKVFSYEQTQEPSDYVPSSDDFELAITNFENAANEEISRGTISGAAIYGSVAIRSYTLRSDFDCLIVPYDHSAESVLAINQIISATNPTGKIDIGAITHPKDRLSRGRHEIDRFFGSHLTGQSILVYGEDPRDYIRFPDYGGYTHLISYIRHKKRSVATSFTSNNSEYYKGLQRVLELPLAVGRKALRVLDELEQTSFAMSDSANKSKIEPASLRLFDSAELGEVPRSITQLNRDYSKLLVDSIEGKIREEEYDAFLHKIARAGMDASQWLDDLDDYLGERCDQQ